MSLEIDEAEFEDELEAEDDQSQESSGNWLVSYSDMVTLLLCFFILFFNVHSGIVKVQAKTIPVNEKKQQGIQSLGPQLNTITMQEIGEKFRRPAGCPHQYFHLTKCDNSEILRLFSYPLTRCQFFCNRVLPVN